MAVIERERERALLQKVASLLRTTTAFIDQERLGVCRCLLAAAAGSSLATSSENLSRLEASIRVAPLEIAQALVAVAHGQERVINERSQFFSLFDLSETLQIGTCSELCKAH